MAYPYATIDTDKTDGVFTEGDHAPHHNELAAALNDLLTELGASPGADLDGVIADLAAHLVDTAAAHAASAVSVTPAGNIASTDVQAALVELDGEKQPLDADLTDLATRWAAASASGPASLDLAEDTDNGTSRVRLIAPASLTADRTLTLVDADGTILIDAHIGSTVQGWDADLDDLKTRWARASASGPASLDFHEDTDNGTNKVTVIAPASVASDKTATLQDVSGTIYVTGGTDVSVADGGTGASDVAGAQTALGISKRQSSAPTGALSETLPRDVYVAGASSLASGTLRLVGIELPIGLLVTSITFVSQSQGAVSPTNWWFCLLDSSRITLRKTADQTSTAWAANTAKTVNLASTFTTTYTGTHYLGIVMAAATPINLHAYTGNATLNALAPTRAGNTTDTGLTTPVDFNPAGAITSSTNVVYGYVS